MTQRRAATVLSLTLAACLAACGDERVPAPEAPPVSGAPIAGVPIAGAPIAGAPIAGTPTEPATPAPASGAPAAPTQQPTTPAPETTGTASAPPSPAAPPVPSGPTAQAPAVPAAEPALGDAAGPDPKVPGEDPIVAAQARAVSEAAAASRTGTDKPAPTAPSASEPKKVVEEKPVADSKKPDPKKEKEKPELIGFDVLGAFEYTAPNPEVPGSFEKAVASIPEDIRNLGGRTVTVEGYMVPLEYAPDDDGVKSFFLSRYQIGCCFGVMPRANELVEVTMQGPKWAPYVSWMPIRATGVIVVGPKEGDTASLSGIYRMHDPEVTVPEPEEVEMQSDHAR